MIVRLFCLPHCCVTSYLDIIISFRVKSILSINQSSYQMEVLSQLLFLLKIIIPTSCATPSHRRGQCHYVGLILDGEGGARKGARCGKKVYKGKFCKHHSNLHDFCHNEYKSHEGSFFSLILRIGHGFCFFNQMDVGHSNYI